MRRSRNGQIAFAVAGIVVVLVIVVLSNALFVVSEMEQVVVTQFGKPVQDVTNPGLYGKIPLIQTVQRYPKRILAWDGDPSLIPTRDKKNIFVDSWARWRIVEPRTFLTSARTIDFGQKILDDLVDSAVRDVVGTYNLIEAVRSTNRELMYETEELAEEQKARQVEIQIGRQKMEERILKMASHELREKYGMELIDVRFKRINYNETLRKAVYAKMVSERLRIVARYLSQAQEASDKIIGQTRKELGLIEGEAYQKDQEIRGQADAEAITIYADAIRKAGDFYRFIRTLEAYKASFDEGTELILTTDSDFMGLLKMKLPGITETPAPLTEPETATPAQ